MSAIALRPHERAAIELPRAALFDSLPMPVVAISADNRLIDANSAAESFFAAGGAALKRLVLDDIAPEGSALRALVDQARDGAAWVREREVIFEIPRAGARLVDLQAAPIAGQPGALVIVIEERTIAEKIDRQLTYRGAARSLSGLGAVLAHEIKNPLFGIRGAAQLLEDALGEEDRALARLIRDEVDRIREIVDRVESFGADTGSVNRAPVNLHEALERARAVAAAGGAGAGAVRFVESYDPSLPPVLGDRDQLIQVFLNLVKNALEAIHSSGGGGGGGGGREGGAGGVAEIRLTTAFRPGMRITVASGGGRIGLPLEVCVIDNGPGVPEDVRPHVFDPFVTTKAQGKGLGLALVAKIVSEHGGVVECDSGAGGTCFRVLLPMHREIESPPPAQDLAEARA